MNEEQDLTDEVMVDQQLPSADGMLNSSKTFDFYKKVFSDPELKGMDYVTAQQLYNDKKITGAKFKSLVGKLDRATASMIDVTNINNYVSDPNILKSPFRDEDVRRVNISYGFKGLNASDPNEFNHVLRRIETYGGIVPKQLQGQISTLVTNGEPIQQLMAAQLMDAMDRTNVNVRNKAFDHSVWQRADRINLYNYKGAQANQVIDQVNESTKRLGEREFQFYSDQALETLAKDKVNVPQKLEASSLGASSRDAELDYVKEYQLVYRGDADLAHKLAMKAVEGRYGTTRFGTSQKTLMEVTPEKIANSLGIASGDETSYVKEDINKFLSPYGKKISDFKTGLRIPVFGETNMPDDTNDAFLVEDKKTKIDGGFTVMGIDPDLKTLVKLVDSKTNKPLRYMVSNPYDGERRPLNYQLNIHPTIFPKPRPQNLQEPSQQLQEPKTTLETRTDQWNAANKKNSDLAIPPSNWTKTGE